MERIASLIQQIQEAHQTGADASHLLLLVHQLQAELQQTISVSSVRKGSSRVAVVLPGSIPFPIVPEPDAAVQPVNVSPPPAEEEKIVEVLQVNESELEAELEEIRKKAEFSKQMQAKQAKMKPGILFEFDEDLNEFPTLIHQPQFQPSTVQEPVKEVNERKPAENPSLNERLKEDTKEIAHRLSEAPVKDLKKAIGINDRFVFINELFRGDEAMYERSIKTINNFSIYPEAQYWMERELKIKLGWDDSRPATQEFYSLVKRRFS